MIELLGIVFHFSKEFATIFDMETAHVHGSFPLITVKCDFH